MNDIPCKCGHKRDVHPEVGKYGERGNDYIVCNDCFLKHRSIEGVKQFNTIDCCYYVPDNLNYLVDKYNGNTSR